MTIYDDAEEFVDVAIVGGGPAGLAAACAFLKTGLTVKVFERMPELYPVGAAIVSNLPVKLHTYRSMTDAPIVQSQLTRCTHHGHNARVVDFTSHNIYYHQPTYASMQQQGINRYT